MCSFPACLPSFRATLKSAGSSTDTRISPADFDSFRTNSSEPKILSRASSSSSCSSGSAFISTVPGSANTVHVLVALLCSVRMVSITVLDFLLRSRCVLTPDSSWSGLPAPPVTHLWVMQRARCCCNVQQADLQSFQITNISNNI